MTKGNIDELRNFSNPPAAVKTALEPVIALILNLSTKPDWAIIKAEVRKDKFKDNILAFKKENIQNKCKNFIIKEYLKDETTYDVAKFMNASKAAGPLAKWLKSIIEFAEIYEQIAPMRAEVATLEEE